MKQLAARRAIGLHHFPPRRPMGQLATGLPAGWLNRLFAVALALISVVGLGSCGAPSSFSQESFVFGTRVEVLVWGQANDQSREAAALVLREFDRLHRTYHAWQPSELTALNEALAQGKPHQVSVEMADLLAEAKLTAARGEFLFDPGIGRLIELWGFHDDSFASQLPDADHLAAWRQAKPSIAALQVAGQTVSSDNAAVAIDFGGYLKGVALDRAAALLKARGVHNALINIGGNVMALGSKGGVAWRVGIQHPRQPTPLATLELRDGEAIGTSGDYQRYFELAGQRYCHLLDPRSGQPSAAAQAVTVLVSPAAERSGGVGMWSDVASKPLFIGGSDWPRLAARRGLTQGLRVDPAGHIEVTRALNQRLSFVPAGLDITIVP